MKTIHAGDEQDTHLAECFEAIKSECPGPIALYGAGRHSARVIALLGDDRDRVSCVLDDAAHPEQDLKGIPVLRPGEADPASVSAVVVSSDSAEEAILPRAQAWADRAGTKKPRVIRLYEGITINHAVLPADVIAFDGTFRLDHEFQECYDASLLAADCADHPWQRPRYYNLINMLRLSRGLDGHTAEAGSFRGQTSYLICHELRGEDPGFDGATHAAFDSFEGFAPPADHDGEFSKHRYNQGAFTGTSVEHFRNTLREFPSVEIHKGWIPSVFGAVPERTYRFVHVDVDLYDPTLASLEYFFPRLVAGGVLVVDDHGPWPNGAYPGCRVACAEFAAAQGVSYATLNTGNAVFIKR